MVRRVELCDIPFVLRLLMGNEMFTVYVIRCWSMEDRGKVILLIINLLITFHSRGDVQREKEREERRVAEASQNLERYKREIGNCQTASREMRDEEARLNDLHDKYMEEAEKAERQARVAEEEAAR